MRIFNQMSIVKRLVCLLKTWNADHFVKQSRWQIIVYSFSPLYSNCNPFTSNFERSNQPSSSLSAIMALLLDLVAEDDALLSSTVVVAYLPSPFGPPLSSISVARGSFDPFAYCPIATLLPKIISISL
uniref:Uncharacterized protein n=1 Tax=Arundo donax TaxID=35708 RepID=A0A0A9FSJ6_ARUDO